MVKQQGYTMQQPAVDIKGFFDVYRLPVATALLESLLEAATLPTVWKQEQPANCLCFMQHIEQLFETACALHKNSNANKIMRLAAGAANTGNLYSHRAGEAFQHSLMAEQFANPVNAISECCRFMPAAEWHQTFHDITACALSNTTIYDMQPECNILRVRRHLLGLLEGCYLIESTKHPHKHERLTK